MVPSVVVIQGEASLRSRMDTSPSFPTQSTLQFTNSSLPEAQKKPSQVTTKMTGDRRMEVCNTRVLRPSASGSRRFNQSLFLLIAIGCCGCGPGKPELVPVSG